MHRTKPDFSDLEEIPNVFPSTNDSGDESIIEDIQLPPDSQSNLRGHEKKVNYSHQVKEAIPVNKRLKNFSTSLPPIDKTKDSMISDDRLNINLSQNKMSFLELHHVLEETNRKKHKSKPSAPKKIVDDDYDELQEDNSFEEESDVRELEKWHLEMKKKNIVQLNERNDIFKSPNKKGPTMSNYEPHLNTDLMNRILMDSDEEKELKKFTKEKVINYQINDDADENQQQPGNQNNKFKGLENAMKETNIEIMDEMIIKKIKHYAASVDMERQTEEQLKYQVKKIAEEIVRHFNSLKSVESITLLHTHIEGIIKKIKKKKVEIAKTFAFKDQKAEETSKLVDYKTMEIVHVKSYEQIVDEMNTLRVQLSNASSHLSSIKAEIHSKQRQLEGIRKKLAVLEEETFKKVEDKPGRTNMEKKLNSPNSSVEEYIKIQKVKYELKKQETEFFEQIDAHEKLAAQFSSEAEKIEAKLRTAKDLKAHTRMKLKELYLKILKDETELQNSTNCSSYSWVLRALWKLGDDISDPSIFPNFLDRDNIDFLVTFAKAQAELEDHCRRYNLQGFTSGMDDFKHLEIMDAKNYLNTESTKESVLPPINKFHEKDRESLLSDVKNRMLDMKRANLKAKRLIHLAQYGPKGKQIIEKWEDVNPAESANLPLVDVNGQYYVPQKSNNDIITHSIEREESKMLTDSPSLPRSKSKIANPLEKANDLLVKVETLSSNELNRIIKTNLNKEFDETAKQSMQKILKYLFGKKESDDYFAKFLREKRIHDLKLNKVPKLANKKKSDSLKISGLNLRHSHNDLSKNFTQDSARRDYNSNSMDYESSMLLNSPLKNSSINKSQPFVDMKAINPIKKSQFVENNPNDESITKNNVTAR